jgi:cytochrome c oxidase assembly protein subunit 15
VVLILAQAALGAFTIWSNKAADVATAHVLVGAVSLVTGALLTTVAFRVLIPVRAAVAVETSARRVVAGQPAAASAK